MNINSLTPAVIREGARLLAKQGLGGSILDPLEKIYELVERNEGLEGIQAKMKYDSLVAFLTKALSEDPLLRRKNTSIFNYILKKRGFKLKKLVPKKAENPKARLKDLMVKLKKTKDQDEKRRLRRKLRRLGHKGGLTRR